MKLEQLRRFLSLGKASIMVGAGFSKNAEMSEGSRMKDWGELCEDFHKELFGDSPTDKDFRLKSALRLAQQLECAKGRNALDELIKTSLPNNSISPGYLHSLLVELPWRDIFTTNYDTLLEDAAAKSFKRYNVVTSKDSLIYQPHPRIVKVHGSFPDNRPFIITEEDYRTYPEKFPEFVNTVRQALIETQFCLIGFSGDDPNFLNWLGWFRDIMGKQMLPVYMVYVGKNPHHSEELLLKDRGIELISTGEVSDDPIVGIDFILSYIGSIHRDQEIWDGSMRPNSFENDNSMIDSIDKMKRIRTSYPGWIILPSDLVNKFDDTLTEFPFMGKLFSNLDKDEQIQFLYEYNWRLNISFFSPIIGEEWFYKAITDYNGKYEEFDSTVKPLINELTLSLLSHKRISDDDGFMELLEQLKSRVSINNKSVWRQLLYEESLWSLQHSDFNRLDSVLKKWELPVDDYRGALWKSKVLIEIGRNIEAKNILETALDSVRHKLLVNTSSAYHSSALVVISNCLSCLTYDRSLTKNLDERFLYKEYAKDCMSYMKSEDSNGRRRKHNFNIGTYRTSWSSGRTGYILKYIGATRFFQISERYGYPVGSNYITYNEVWNKAALPLIAAISTRSSVLLLNEVNNRDALDEAFNRNIVSSIDKVSAYKFFEFWIAKLEGYCTESNWAIGKGRFGNVIIPMLSRLSIWVNESDIIKLIEIIWKLYDNSWYDFAADLRLAYNSLDNHQSEEIWWKVLAHPITLGYRKEDLPHPSAVVDEWKGNVAVINIIKDGLVSTSYDIRRAAIYRLCLVYQLLPPEFKLTIDQLISDNFDAIKSPDFLSHLGVWRSMGNHVWDEQFEGVLHERLDRFKDSQVTEFHSSNDIENFTNDLMVFVNSMKILTENEKNEIILKIAEFFSSNGKQLMKDDSESLLGGFKRFYDDTVLMINHFISDSNYYNLEDDVRNTILSSVVELSPIYNTTAIIIELSFKLNNKKNLYCSNDEKLEIIRQIKNNINSKEENRIAGAFESLVRFNTLSNNRAAIQDIIQDVINQIKFLYNEQSVIYLKHLSVWVKAGIIKSANLNNLIKILIELPSKALMLKDKAELTADLLYYGAKLVGFMSVMALKSEAFRGCIEDWKNLCEDESLPNDIRKGFKFGQQIGSLKH